MSTRSKKIVKNNPPTEDVPRRATRSVKNSVDAPSSTNVSNTPANGPVETKKNGKSDLDVLCDQPPTYRSPAVEKRKRSDTTTQEADKRAPTKAKRGKSGGSHNGGNTANTTSNPAEQGGHFHNKFSPFLQIVAATNQPVVVEKTTGRKVLPRPELSLDSASDEGDSGTSGLLDYFFSKREPTDCVTDDSGSHAESDDNAMSLPTAENLLEEVSPFPDYAIVWKQWHFNYCQTRIKMVTGGQNNIQDTDDSGHVADLRPTVRYGGWCTLRS